MEPPKPEARFDQPQQHQQQQQQQQRRSGRHETPETGNRNQEPRSSVRDEEFRN